MITKAIDDGTAYDVIMCDFAKAFDKVPFDCMLMKVAAHGVRGQLFRWIENWTMERRQRVVLNGGESDWAHVTSSVVQGSVLGPILFIIFINCLDAAVKGSDEDTLVSKYADDTKVGRAIEDSSDCVKLQAAADHLVKWCNDWGMSLHPQKCIVLHKLQMLEI